jgi:hypothetical protein
MTMSANRERDRQSLKDLAKMAQGLTPPPGTVAGTPSSALRAGMPLEEPKPSHDSGVIDLESASLADPGAAVRAQSTPLATQGLFDQDSDSLRPGPVEPVTHQTPVVAAAVAPMAAPSAQPGPRPTTQPATKSSGNSTMLIAVGLGGILALSAVVGGFVVVRSRTARNTEQQVPTTEARTVAKAEPQATAQAAPQNDAPKEIPAAAEAAPTTQAANALAVADPAAPAAQTAKAEAKTGAKPAGQAAPAVAPAPSPAPAKAKDTKAANAAASGPAGDLGAAIKKEVGADEIQKAEAKAASAGGASAGNLPQKPSQGAVTGAIGAVLPAARACLGPDDPVSRASIVFASSGSAQSVSVSGGAAGKPAEACIKDALMKAKVQPFADPTYSANITVRHN